MGLKLRLFTVLSLFMGCLVFAQKGVGENKGVSQDEIPIGLVELNGVVQNVVEGPCSYTLGDSEQGVHLIVCTDDEQELNVHVGPVWAVSIWTEGIVGHPVHLVVFTTENLPNNHFIAKELQWDGQKAEFRDGYLKPFWADRHEKEIW